MNPFICFISLLACFFFALVSAADWTYSFFFFAALVVFVTSLAELGSWQGGHTMTDSRPPQF
ncbi:MAG: hypothetical protein KC910_06820 [Candidatus Eremiobacteraeota bacterium]|nr:hypothetical protein [Candidatus Eremiobacteraeota bacterium]